MASFVACCAILPLEAALSRNKLRRRWVHASTGHWGPESAHVLAGHAQRRWQPARLGRGSTLGVWRLLFETGERTRKESGTALTAEYSAPSAGPPPWVVQLDEGRAVSSATGVVQIV